MNNDKRPLYIPYAGPALLATPLLNKGSAFSAEERSSFNLEGLLPESTETIQEQVERAYQQYKSFESDMDKHIYLRNIQDTNETLYYRLVQNHISEMMPIIYTPTVGAACENFSNIYRRGRGLFISYPNRDRIDDLLNNAANHNVKVIVVTDGERILGLGDQGIGGMGIPIGKLSLYTACGGISPAYTLPIVLDVGTNNPQRLADPMYMGWRHPRITGAEYDAFVEEFIQAVQRRWPDALIQFEDFAQKNAMPLLERYKDRVCCFNDDIQGTAAVTVGSLLAACKAAGTQLSKQRITFLGAGSAGCGIAEAIIAQMVSEGISDEQARSQVYMVDRWGLLQEGMPNLLDFQQRLVQKHTNTKEWENEGNGFSLLDVMRNAKPTVLIGVSGAPGLFSQEVIEEMHKHCKRPIVFPLSNPTSRVEATPNDIIRWTNGEALVATGSPFEPVVHEGRTYPIAQCNNSYIFPGIGLGVLAVNAKRVTDEMLMESSRALATCSPLAINGRGALLPPLEEIHLVSKKIAFAVGKKAIEQGVALEITDEALNVAIEQSFWQPVYRRYKRTAF
ncbi:MULTISPECIES: NAD-dependent malic enzyme [Vibrio]|jgi:malate dehydrogenase (oxaloacetate-decarboxylating)|uniref:NAD-dependent malic enzyme n=4 Tax=Vibrio TaxID=662 RepID=A0A0H0YH57_VIBAL|nr:MULTISPECIES: NAD-dependent malic enzyme [Vibrio]MDG2786720.1 NAD-dependent malic enzyme [Vibrio parahaemolyticus]MDW1808128.1 NAD-dependent malic enzyme [Vibrio sp. Vb2362]MDW1970493.1 NAD-dependent malic enzyme [Vibrio sp. 945]MDW2256665.1 NAD-dependent malic enzyme [Vibrio sp. 1409]MDW2294052.1 NAD-dependent malic enzyme [Vibrio sp. 1404]NAW54918.1 oxaloacetate-decarboxylating malate dehydrogenase [Vibrio sp. V41_P2S12T139]NAW96146.1 oxaloacetate-decarboxylating malate dehydrogenase [V